MFWLFIELNLDEKQEVGDTFPMAAEAVSVMTAEGEE